MYKSYDDRYDEFEQSIIGLPPKWDDYDGPVDDDVRASEYESDAAANNEIWRQEHDT